ncbi:hypothetical protein SDC9_184856 [bioreactor metagenome]|uniref:Uncharacterized protein n=1 Tax=bioreactor metagenome TaxID=1076179 RepID=A0A645HGN1_9ZZZZ
MVDARRIGDDQRRALVSFGFVERFDKLGRVCAHVDRGNVDIAVRGSHHAQILLARAFACRRKLGD